MQLEPRKRRKVQTSPNSKFPPGHQLLFRHPVNFPLGHQPPFRQSPFRQSTSLWSINFPSVYQLPFNLPSAHQPHAIIFPSVYQLPLQPHGHQPPFGPQGNAHAHAQPPPRTTASRLTRLSTLVPAALKLRRATNRSFIPR